MDAVKLRIQKWLSDLESGKLTDKFVFLLIGASGIGKSSLVKEVFSDTNYYLHTIKTENNKKVLKNLLSGITNSKQNILSKKYSGNAILIDDLDGISTNDRSSISEIIDTIKEITQRAKRTGVPPLPIICISTKNYLKKKKELMKLCIECNIDINLDSKILEIINNWTIEYSIKLSKNTISLLIKYAQNDLHRLKNILRYLQINSCTEKKVSDLIKALHQKTITNHLYDSCKILLTSSISIQEALTAFRQERTLLPLMMHENFSKFIPSKDLLTQKLILKSLSKSMMIETLLFNKNEWDLQNIYSFRSCFLPSHFIKNKKFTKKQITYTMLLNKTSLHHTYIHKYRDKLMIKPDINLYFSRSKIKELIDNYTPECNERYLADYGWTLKDIQDLKKII